MTDTEISMARLYAADISQKLSGAYWSSDCKEFLLLRAHDDFAALAAIMGYRVERLEPEPETTADLVDQV